jgi:hypothetical protein
MFRGERGGGTPVRRTKFERSRDGGGCRRSDLPRPSISLNRAESDTHGDTRRSPGRSRNEGVPGSSPGVGLSDRARFGHWVEALGGPSEVRPKLTRPAVRSTRARSRTRVRPCPSIRSFSATSASSPRTSSMNRSASSASHSARRSNRTTETDVGVGLRSHNTRGLRHKEVCSLFQTDAPTPS